MKFIDFITWYLFNFMLSSKDDNKKPPLIDLVNLNINDYKKAKDATTKATSSDTVCTPGTSANK